MKPNDFGRIALAFALAAGTMFLPGGGTLARRIEPYLAHWIGDQGAFIATFADIPTCSLH